MEFIPDCYITFLGDHYPGFLDACWKFWVFSSFEQIGSAEATIKGATKVILIPSPKLMLMIT